MIGTWIVLVKICVVCACVVWKGIKGLACGVCLAIISAFTNMSSLVSSSFPYNVNAEPFVPETIPKLSIKTLISIITNELTQSVSIEEFKLNLLRHGIDMRELFKQPRVEIYLFEHESVRVIGKLCSNIKECFHEYTFTKRIQNEYSCVIYDMFVYPQWKKAIIFCEYYPFGDLFNIFQNDTVCKTIQIILE